MIDDEIVAWSVLIDKAESSGRVDKAIKKRVRKSSRRDMLKYVHGVSLEWYNEQLFNQGGVCYICKRPPSSKKSLNVDHNHKTGEIRKLLCHNCNVALGMLREDVGIINSMKEYVIEHS